MRKQEWLTQPTLFSHPDFTVGQGISPCRERHEALFADFTAGMESHQSPKILLIFYCRINLPSENARHFPIRANARQKPQRLLRQNFHEARVFKENRQNRKGFDAEIRFDGFCERSYGITPIPKDFTDFIIFFKELYDDNLYIITFL